MSFLKILCKILADDVGIDQTDTSKTSFRFLVQLINLFASINFIRFISRAVMELNSITVIYILLFVGKSTILNAELIKLA